MKDESERGSGLVPPSSFLLHPFLNEMTMNRTLNQALSITRRHFLRDCPLALGGLAYPLMGEGRADSKADTNPFAPRPPHFKPKAKSVIFLHMAGSPPHLDLFDYKPELVKRNGENCPESFLKGRRFAFTSGVPKLLGTPQKFA